MKKLIALFMVLAAFAASAHVMIPPGQAMGAIVYKPYQWTSLPNGSFAVCVKARADIPAIKELGSCQGGYFTHLMYSHPQGRTYAGFSLAPSGDNGATTLVIYYK